MLNPQCGIFIFRGSHDAETVMAATLVDKLQFTECALPARCDHFDCRTATFFRRSRLLSDTRKLRLYKHLFICRTVLLAPTECGFARKIYRGTHDAKLDGEREPSNYKAGIK